MRVFVILLISTVFWMCTQPAGSEQEQSSNEGNAYFEGESFEYDDVMTVGQVMAALSEQDSVPAVVEATVSNVCQAKGCWMDVVGTDGDSSSIFVQFKDYGFFMPKDLAGGNVVMKGYAYKSVTTVEELRHFAEDEGLSEEEIAAITEPEEEIKFLASGVEIKK